MPEALRFYARLLPLEVECPGCGRIIAHELMVGVRRRRHRGDQRARKSWQILKLPAYNPVTGQLHCPFCLRRYALGVVAWEVQPGRPTGEQRQRPADQAPTLAERRELRKVQQALRADTGGFHPTAAELVRPGDPLNLRIDRPCTCPQTPAGRRKFGAWSPHCPVHGDPAMRQESPMPDP